MSAKPLLKVIFMEDSPDDGLFISRKLKEVATVMVCATGPEFQEQLKSHWDVILVDYHLHGITGDEAIQMSRKMQPEIPVIIVTGSIHDEEASAVCRSGAVDFVLKDRPERLPMAVSNAHENRMLRVKQSREQRLELLGDLSAGVAHDMNNLLGVMLGGVDLVRRNVKPADRKILDMLESTCQKGAELMKQMMAFARGNDSGAYKSVSSKYLVGEIDSMLRSTFPSNIRLVVNTAAGTAQLFCNESAINQVLLNLAVNARDAMTPNGGELWISAQNTTLPAGKFVCVTVKDTGKGISKAELPHIFEPFFTTKGKKGTGLGLSLVKQIIEAHAGTVEVSSSKKGTEFQIFLPVATDAEKTTEDFDGTGRTVLLVDDTDFIRTWIKLLLEENNYTVIEANCGVEAMHLFLTRQEAIDVLVTDVAMPLMSGPELARSCRDLVPNLRVIYVTGLDSGGVPRVPKASATLQKPFTAKTLLKTLNQVVTGTIQP